MKMTEPIIIAEAGINHNGDFAKAIELIKAAHESKADFVKFHATCSDRITNKNKFNALWRDEHGEDEPFSSFVKRVEFSVGQFKTLLDFSIELGIEFMVTPYDLHVLDQMLDLGIKNIKLASCDLIKDEYVKLATKKAKLLVLATGMASESEIQHAINLVEPQKTYVLHCISEYPAPVDRSNLKYIEHLTKTYQIKAGFSDHTDDIIIPLIAVAKGAVMVEKHLMLENDNNCPDHKVSVTKEKLSDLVFHAKNMKNIMGSGKKIMSDLEIANRKKFRYRWK